MNQFANVLFLFILSWHRGLIRRVSIDKEQVMDSGSFDILFSGVCDIVIFFSYSCIYYRGEAFRGGDRQ